MNYLYEIHSYVADYKVTFSVNIWDLATSMRSLILSGNVRVYQIFSFLVYNSIPNIYRFRSLLLFSRFNRNGYLTLCFFTILYSHCPPILCNMVIVCSSSFILFLYR